jgi:site-specific DNA-methyltransferase (adenine-specific)
MKNSIHLTDCNDFIVSNLETLKGTIDLICIDPPYGINFADNDWDLMDSFQKSILVFNYFFDILKPTGSAIIFSGWSNFDQIKTRMEERGFVLRNTIAYDRIKGRGASKNLVSTLEMILWFTKDPDQWTFNKLPSNTLKVTKGMGEKNGNPYRAMSNVWSDIPPLVPWSKERVKHPTQKSLALMERIIKVFSNEGDFVLDCFAGSGSTGVACQKLKRDYLLVEKEEEYFQIIQQRLTPPTEG